MCVHTTRVCHMIILSLFFFFFSSRRRHTRCALVTEFRRVLFRSPASPPTRAAPQRPRFLIQQAPPPHASPVPTTVQARTGAANQPTPKAPRNARSEERRVGKECVSTVRSRRSPYH